MPIPPTKIPQNVYIEDRIIGPLTLRQIIICIAGGGISYILWAMVSKNAGYVGIPLTIVVWIPALIAAAFAFVKVNDLSLLRICFLMLERMSKPSLRVWETRRGISINIRTFSVPHQDTSTPHTEKKIEQIDELTTTLDSATPPIPVRPGRVTVSPMEDHAAGVDGLLPHATNISLSPSLPS